MKGKIDIVKCRECSGFKGQWHKVGLRPQDVMWVRCENCKGRGTELVCVPQDLNTQSDG